MDRVLTIRFSLRSVAAVVALLAVFGLALRMPGLLVEVFLALVVASALLPGVRHLETRARWPRPAAVVALFVAVVGTLAILGSLIVPQVIDQAASIATSLPKLAGGWSTWYEWLRHHAPLGRMLPAPSTLPGRLGVEAGQVLGQSVDWARRTLEAVTTIAVILVLAFFFLLDGPRLRRGLLCLVPPPYRAVVDAQIDPIALKLGSYVKGTLLSMAFFIVFQAIGLSLAGLPLALGVAVLAGVLEVIPLLGTVVGLALGVSLAATVSVHMVVVVLIIFAAGRLIQDNLVNPYVFSQSLELPPTLVIVALLIGAELMGLMGALIAVPLLAALQVLVQNLYVAPMEAKRVAQPAEAAREATPLGVTFLGDVVEPVRLVGLEGDRPEGPGSERA